MGQSRTALVGPLSGLKVIEMAGLGPAPFCGMMFADMGAEVVLVDRKPTQASNNAADPLGSDPRDFEICHRNKSSVSVNLKERDGVDLVLDLIRSADLLIEGFRPGVMERLGLGPDEVMARNPALVFGRMTGWGQEGPLAHTAGHEPNYLAVSGAFHYARHGGAPWSPMTFGGDVGAGATLLAWGCLSALFQAQRSGQGRVVDAAIVDGAAYNSALLLMLRNASQIDMAAGNSWVDGAAPWSDAYTCADGGYVTLCALEPKFYAQLVSRMGFAQHPAFADQWERKAWPEMRQALQDEFAAASRDHWTQVFEGSDACVAAVLSFEEAQQNSHMASRNVFLDAVGGVQPAVAPRISNVQHSYSSPPRVGADTDEVLVEFGIDSQSISRLQSDGII